MLWIHVAAGVLALLAGAVALSVAKGGRVHRRSGMLFAASMVVMTLSAVIAATWLRPNLGNMVAGTLTFYLVLTGVLAVKRTVAQARTWLVGLMTIALGVGGFALLLAFMAQARPNGAIDSIPAGAFFMFAFIGLLAGLLDVRLLVAGHIEGKHRLARHLWRIGYAMWIATLSFFFGQADELPQAIRATGVLMLPPLLVTLTLLYWVIRIQVARQPLRSPWRRGPKAAAVSTPIGEAT